MGLDHSTWSTMVMNIQYTVIFSTTFYTSPVFFYNEHMEACELVVNSVHNVSISAIYCII